jgi:hypothetical protein
MNDRWRGRPGVGRSGELRQPISNGALSGEPLVIHAIFRPRGATTAAYAHIAVPLAECPWYDQFMKGGTSRQLSE